MPIPEKPDGLLAKMVEMGAVALDRVGLFFKASVILQWRENGSETGGGIWVAIWRGKCWSVSAMGKAHKNTRADAAGCSAELNLRSHRIAIYFWPTSGCTFSRIQMLRNRMGLP